MASTSLAAQAALDANGRMEVANGWKEESVHPERRSAGPESKGVQADSPRAFRLRSLRKLRSTRAAEWRSRMAGRKDPFTLSAGPQHGVEGRAGGFAVSVSTSLAARAALNANGACRGGTRATCAAVLTLTFSQLHSATLHSARCVSMPYGVHAARFARVSARMRSFFSRISGFMYPRLCSRCTQIAE